MYNITFLEEVRWRGAIYWDRDCRGSYHCEMFTTWLLEQSDRDDSVGVLARLLFHDYNAGCALMYKDPLGWMQHFKQAHGRVSEKVKDMLGDAYVEYVDTLSTK